MLRQLDCKKSQEDARSLGQMVIECLEPTTFLRKGESLTLDSWDPMLSIFVNHTKSKSVHELIEVREQLTSIII
jgi:hypothetical protein